eukprot:XP_004920906.2 PREDICTED: NXPE family member 4-like [Xenopus tropicalis]
MLRKTFINEENLLLLEILQDSKTEYLTGLYINICILIYFKKICILISFSIYPLLFRMKFFSKLLLAAAMIILIKFLVFREDKIQVPKATYPFQMCSDQSQKEAHSSKTAPVPDALNRRIDEIYNQIDKSIPKIKLENFDEATSAGESKATIVNQKDGYCLGEQLFVRVQAYDYLGNMKSYGGDYLRARIFSPKTNSSASGNITDYNNGTYLIAFTLFWEGEVTATVL